MGNQLPKPVTSVAIKRFAGTSFRAGLAEMNGWRPSMEDAHAVLLQPTWGFFGVFDGHGGSQCSSFVARRFVEELRKAGAPPEDDEALKTLALRLDSEFLESGKSSGSTATFAFVSPPATEGGRFAVRVGNVGDSRVLLGHSDGSMFEGGGTDGALTTDHKPDNPAEQARIERNGGGNVFDGRGGVVRENGSGITRLAVSRAFGDRAFKEFVGQSQEEQPVIAVPDVVHLECDATDFLILVCDGISEGKFPNREVVRFASEELSSHCMDPGAAAAAVCQRALDRGSHDNLSCMVVLLGGGEVRGSEEEFIPGPLDGLSERASFYNAYAAFAERSGRTLAEAADLRYCLLHKQLLENDRRSVQAVRGELHRFHGGPPTDLAEAERRAWFEAWLDSVRPREAAGGATSPRNLRTSPTSPGAADDGLEPKRLQRLGPVQVVSQDLLRSAVEAHATMEWQDELLELAGRRGVVIDVDEEADLAQVKFSGGREWLPTTVLLSQ